MAKRTNTIDMFQDKKTCMHNVPDDHTDMFVSESVAGQFRDSKEWLIWGPQAWKKSYIMKDI